MLFMGVVALATALLDTLGYALASFLLMLALLQALSWPELRLHPWRNATALLAVSVGGIFFLPFLALAMLSLAILGGLALCVRLGAWMRRGTGESPLFLFTSGLLGLFVVSLPGLAGVAAALFRGPAAAAVAGVLRSVDAVAALLLLAWGFGTGLAQIRAGQRKG
jgi:hypothetical protein